MAAQCIDVDPVLLGRIERGEYRVRPEQIEALLNLYGVTDPDVYTELRAASLEPSDAGWWHPYRNKLSPTFLDFVALESEAEEILSASPSGVPGLVQTLSYAQEIQEADPVESIRSDADMYVRVRLSRQQAILRTRNPAHLRCLIPEAVFHSASPSIGEQIGSILSFMDRDNITIQVMPMAAPVGTQVDVYCTLMKFRSPWPSVMYASALGAGFLNDDVETTRIVEERFVAFEQAALPVDRTREFLKERLRKIHHEG